jgi:diguanylate cyclase (GGDEF)-like protein
MPGWWGREAPDRRFVRPWQWYVLVSLVLALVYVVAPWQPVQAIGSPLVHLSTTVAIVAGLKRHPTARARAPWYALAANVGLFAAGEVVYWIETAWLHRDAFPSAADGFYVGSTSMLLVALAGFSRARRNGLDRAGLLDAAVLSVGAGMLSWLYLISPTAHQGDLSLLGRTVSLLYPVLDLLALVALARLSVSAGRKPPAYGFLVAGLISLLFTDALYTLLELNGAYLPGGVLDLGWMGAHVRFAAAALHPSAPAISRPAPPVGQGSLGQLRLVGLATASLIAPFILIAEWLQKDTIDAPVIAGGSIALYLLVLARLQGVVKQLALSLDSANSQAQTDPLTGLANRRQFHARWQQHLGEGPGPTALLYVDLDGFKAVNDQLGHAAGDAVLQVVAERIGQVVRSGDVLARLGGDEFAVILPGAGDRHADDIAARILAAVSVPITVQGTSVRVGASVGVVSAPLGADPDTEIRRADAAMYGAKTGGRGRVVRA